MKFSIGSSQPPFWGQWWARHSASQCSRHGCKWHHFPLNGFGFPMDLPNQLWTETMDIYLLDVLRTLPNWGYSDSLNGSVLYENSGKMRVSLHTWVSVDTTIMRLWGRLNWSIFQGKSWNMYDTMEVLPPSTGEYRGVPASSPLQPALGKGYEQELAL